MSLFCLAVRILWFLKRLSGSKNQKERHTERLLLLFLSVSVRQNLFWSTGVFVCLFVSFCLTELILVINHFLNETKALQTTLLPWQTFPWPPPHPTPLLLTPSLIHLPTNHLFLITSLPLLSLLYTDNYEESWHHSHSQGKLNYSIFQHST